MRQSFAPRFAQIWTIPFSDSRALEAEIKPEDIVQLKAAQAELEAVFKRGCPRETIGQIIDLMAEMFQANVPSPDALAIWFSLLKTYPEEAVKAGARAVAMTHKWPRLPLPADFIAAIEATPEYLALDSERGMYALMLTRLSRLGLLEDKR